MKIKSILFLLVVLTLLGYPFINVMAQIQTETTPLKIQTQTTQPTCVWQPGQLATDSDTEVQGWLHGSSDQDNQNNCLNKAIQMGDKLLTGVSIKCTSGEQESRTPPGCSCYAHMGKVVGVSSTSTNPDFYCLFSPQPQ